MATASEAIEWIKGRIVAGDLKPGDRLPRESDLASELGISRNSLREAIGALAMFKILDVRQGAGTYVTSLESKLLLEAISFVADFQRDDSVLEYFEVRKILEPAASAMVARRATQGEVGHLREITDAISTTADVEELVENDLQFHSYLADISGNSVLASLIKNLAPPTFRGRIWRALTQSDAHEVTLREHSAIVEAISDRQDDVAAARTLTHIAGIESWLRASISAGRDGASFLASRPKSTDERGWEQRVRDS
jgi:DNA-binding FadR family transcriptional regulator